ncbi:MAG TPA: YjbH domain-containing protein [Rhizomicrobium sp.]|nr:YjbH domain-containing protein [Rhizomicrobium sp.]
MAFWSLALAAPALADTTAPHSTYGDVGILDMPSARMTDDGQFGVTAGILNNNQRYDFWFQLLPWLEGSFRYAHIGHFSPSGPLYDRSLGIKLRLGRETEYWPEISLGIRDLLGTGVYGSEYLVASKRFGDFDLTGGLGWGRLASDGTLPNPFGAIFKSFKVRDSGNFGLGGVVSFNTFFHGPNMGIFGGAIWHSPVDNLDVLLEYSSDRYVEERANKAFSVRIPVNVGLAYRPLSNLAVSAGWYYGTTYGVTLTVSANPTISAAPERLSATLPQPIIRTPQQQSAALADLLKPGQSKIALATATPWVRVAPTAPDPNAHVISSLMAIGTGVRDVEIYGNTLMVDAQQNSAKTQCSVYAKIVSAVDGRIRTIAVSDLHDGDGQTYFCPVLQSANFVTDADSDRPAAGDAPTADADDAPGPSPGDYERKLRTDIAAQSIRIEALSVERSHVWVYYSNLKYYSEAEAAGRVARLLMNDTPPSVEIFHLVLVKNGLPLREIQMTRSALERANSTYASGSEMGLAIEPIVPPLSNPILERAQDESYPRLHWSIGPGLSTALFDPAEPLQLQLLASLSGSIEVTPTLAFEGTFEANIYNNFNLSLKPDSLLPHVRSDILEYYRHGINGIANLDATYRMRLSRTITAEFKAGYLESMFAGAGGQVLWRPEGQRFAVGVDAYEVWQRDFDRLFGVQDYHVLTGHVSLYYASPWYGLNFNVHAGRYLAGDYGATFEITRRFSTGVEIGAFATFTNVPFAKFGEGSFDKGLIIHIPLEWALPFYSKSSYDLLLRSLTRDGGQRLVDDDSLYGETRPFSYEEVMGHVDDITAP